MKSFEFLSAIMKKFKSENIELSTSYQARAIFMGCSLGILFILLISRYAYLSLLPNDLRALLRQQGLRQFEVDVKLAPQRAPILDRQGRPLAVSVLQPSLFVIPKRIPTDLQTLKIVAKQIGISVDNLHSLSKTKKGFSWLKRKMTKSEFEKIGDISDWHDFLGFIDEPKRIYPEKETAAHLIGFVGLDDKGLEGIEKVYDKQLRGQESTVKVSRDARGRLTLITPNNAVKPEQATDPLNLSIDLSIQSFAEAALRQGVIKAQARGGSAVVMDIESSELLAIASYPTYDLNNPPDNQPEKRRFRPLMDALELGSVVKPVFIAAALDKGVIKPDEKLFCENGKLSLPGGKIRDDHPHGMLSIKEVIKYSSNICTYKIMQRLGRNSFYDAVIRSGLARNVGTGLPGEWAGHISPPDTWREMRFANMAFGQGIAISPLQMIHTLAILTGGGSDQNIRILTKPTAEKQNLVGPVLQYVTPKTSRIITEMMSSVVEEEGGTGSKASIPGVSVAGKTGTAQKFNTQTKSYSDRIASFVGVLPAENPKLAIVVVIDEPKVRPAYGGTLAGPVFSEIGFKTIQYLNSLGVLAINKNSEVSPMVKAESHAQ